MKRIHTIITMLAVMLATFTLSGCDEDEYIANNLWGVWQGNMYVESYYNGRTYKSAYSVLAFDKDPYSYAQGTGYWVDYYSNAPWDYYSSRIEWRVVNSEIQIYSIKEGRTYYIYDYNMARNFFNGYLSTGSGSSLYFELQKTSSPNWDSYDWDGYNWNYSYGSGYSPYSIGETAGSQTTTDAPEPIRRIKGE